MNKTTEKQVFTRAISIYGSDEQMRVAQEECAELIQAISKYHRMSMKKKAKNDHRYLDRTIKNLKEEIVDVQIMLDQLKLMFGFTQKELDEIREGKIERLSNHLPGPEEE